MTWSHLEDVGDRMHEIIDSMKRLFAATERIGERLNELRFGSRDALYEISRAPRERPASTILSGDNLQRFFLGAFLVALLGVVAVLFVNILRRPDEPSR